MWKNGPLRGSLGPVGSDPFTPRCSCATRPAQPFSRVGERSRRVLNFKHRLCTVGASRLHFSVLCRSPALCECVHGNSPLPAEAGRLEQAGLVPPPVRLAMELAESLVAPKQRAVWPPRRDRAQPPLSRAPLPLRAHFSFSLPL